jgi:hypothetical protein
MILSGALTMALAIAASAEGERLLLCRPKVLGEPALARAEALTEAAHRPRRGRWSAHRHPSSRWSGEMARSRSGTPFAVRPCAA